MSAIPGFDAALSSAMLSVEARKRMLLPWETNPWLKSILGDDNAEVKRPRLSMITGVESAATSSRSGRQVDSIEPKPRSLAISKVSPLTTHLRSTDAEPDRQKAVDAWLLILRINLAESSVGRQIEQILRDVVEVEAQTVEVNSTMSLTTRGKSVNTLLQRACCLSQFLNWASESSVPRLPISESMVFDYLRSEFLRSKGATTGTRLIEALAFADGVFGIKGAGEASKSARVKGAALDRYLQKAPRCPARSLTDLQLYALEVFLADPSKCEHERIGAGALLFLAYCRARASDSFRIKSLIVDRLIEHPLKGFVEASAMRVKNARSAELKTSLLPITGPLAGLGRDRFGAWYDTFDSVRTAAGLASLESVSDSELVLWPKLCLDNSYSKLACTPDDHTKLLRTILSQAGWSEEELKETSSHSCKASLLSFCAKAGVAESERRVLGL